MVPSLGAFASLEATSLKLSVDAAQWRAQQGAFASLEATSLKLRPVAALHCGLPPAPLVGLVNYDFDSCLRLLGAGWRPF